MKIIKFLLPWQEDQSTQGMLFLPSPDKDIKPSLAVFAHGYTADKTDLLPWAMRLTEEGISCAIFDWPGHYLGNYSEVKDFDRFKAHAHTLFIDALDKLKAEFKEHFPLNEHFLEPENLNIILGGHSLGALLSLFALKELKDYPNKRAIAIGLGIVPQGKTHLFASAFYKSTLAIRAQYVSPALNPTNVFGWIKEAKLNVPIQNQKVHLINGEDDIVVGDEGSGLMITELERNQNEVTLERPSKLPHHEPKLAASYIKRYLKKENLI